MVESHFLHSAAIGARFRRFLTPRSLASAATILAILSLGLGWLWWQAVNAPTTYYLPRYTGADWIIYPRPNWLAPHAAVPLDATFRQTFSLDHKPQRAWIEYRAFGVAEVVINGKPIETALTPNEPYQPPENNAAPFASESRLPSLKMNPSWKRAKRREVSSLLKVGENAIRVTVTNDVGPPALWLRFVGESLRVGTDTTWEARLAGSIPRKAQAVRSPPMERHLGTERLYQIDTLSAAKWAWKPLVGAAAIGLVVAGAVGFMPSRRPRAKCRRDEKPTPNSTKYTRLAALFRSQSSRMWVWWLAVASVWFGVATHNQPWLTANMGFDSTDHLEYIEFIQRNHRLPLAEDGREMHQPPLFYVVSAGWLSLFGETPTSDRGLALLRLLTAALGALHFGLIGASLRVIFPQDRNLAVLGMLFAAALPMHLYIFQYISNESMTAVLSASVIYATLRMLVSGRFSLLWGACLGVLLGAALLSKITTLVLPPVIVTVAASRLIVQRQFACRDWLGGVVLPLIMCVMVSGWQYYRNWQHYGTPLVRHIDLPDSEGGATWKDPGFREVGDLVRFGGVLKHPLITGFRSLPDAMYSTYWGDGRCGGRGMSGVRPAWNYNLMVAGYLLAIVPMSMLIVGLLLATVRMVRRPTAIWYLLVGLLFSMLFALSYEALRHPYLTVTKAWYGIPATTAVAALLALAVKSLAGKSRWRKGALWGLLAAWMTTSVLSFWIPANRSRAWYSLGVAYADQQADRKASQCFTQAIQANPMNARAIWRLGRVTARMGNVQKALRLMAHAMSIDPKLGACALDMAVLLRRAGRTKDAQTYAHRAAQLAPHEPEAHRLLGDLLAQAGKPKEAVEALVRVIPLRPTDARIYFRLAKIYDIAGQGRAAIRNAQRAVWTSRGAASMRVQYAGLLIKYGYVDQGVQEYERLLADEPDSADAAAGLAWFLSAYPDPAWRNGHRAVELAQLATKQDPENVIYWRTLAVAYAEAGRFDEALTITQLARELVDKHGWPRRYKDLLKLDEKRYRQEERLPLNSGFSVDADSPPNSR